MFEIVTEFENKIAEFFGAPYAVSTDCCTHAIELSLLYTNPRRLSIPYYNYLSIPMTAKKLNLNWTWHDKHWEEYYKLEFTNIYDAAVLWKQNSYIKGSFMCLSFQYRKHLSLGRGVMILTDDRTAYTDLIKLGYDGRTRDKPWAEQEVDSLGYHYYMTPEIAQTGLDKLPSAIASTPKKWSWKDYPDLRNMPLFAK
jgi:dTDP-4-amino-4,6-dideoxygalactose transaminase